MRLIAIVAFDTLNSSIIERMDADLNQIRNIRKNVDGWPKSLGGRRFQNGRESDDRIARIDKFGAQLL